MTPTTQPIQAACAEAQALVRQVLTDYRPSLTLREMGEVQSVRPGIARVTGLPGVRADELVYFPSSKPGGTPLLGIAFNLDPDEVGVILLGDSPDLQAGDRVYRTERVMDVPVGEGLLGRVVTAMGEPLDDRGPLNFVERRPVEHEAPAILDRAPVTVPLQTGLKVVDALIPIGRGQRELIIGDRQTGKTAIAIDTILNQQETGVICIYCAIGQRSAAMAKVIATLREQGAMDYTVVVVAAGQDPLGLQYITPYGATTMGEYFMEQGRDVLIVYDDLTHHARTYRELSLLLRRPPGREAYPGDIFYLHSRLLERATHLSPDLGGGSLTALPIIETQAQNLSAYIPTNLISITDGQVYLSPDLFQKSIFPAVDVGKSVSRVGGKTQLPAYQSVAGDLRLSYAQFQEVEVFARFGTQLDEQTRRTLERGRRIRAVLKQRQSEPLTAAAQIAILFAVTSGLLDAVPLDQIDQAQAHLAEAMHRDLPDISAAIHQGQPLTEADLKTLAWTLSQALG
ncbi:alternate F1F0 ATPase, F1 subunit alpha [Leptolyngbya sp. BL0902]|uniref:alternate F1F0 ATPase, F1 subunit alpha n=1 Tax=Leptolyngbya sp. BL0902 TaxID=1115757 RepID=UPI0018E7987E|nr:alternate F1F0 ATPase, F1 subunit alpha [Leptolyngbya sp. BL0902]QQE63674.1 alternate F1F0 ATPase, F1 subunit alpha [Leptolyngbya sp. BL0902]